MFKCRCVSPEPEKYHSLPKISFYARTANRYHLMEFLAEAIFLFREKSLNTFLTGVYIAGATSRAGPSNVRRLAVTYGVR